jgi:hypothetical protein
MKKLVVAALAGVVALAGLTGCMSDADIASENVSKAADNFEVGRRVTVVNGITDKYLLVIEGYCSLGNSDKEREISVTCKDVTGYGGFKKYFVTLSDNVIVLTEQLQASQVSTERSRVVFKPESIIPDIRVGG